MPRALTAVLLLSAAATVLLAGAPASAHNELIASVPAAGSSVSAAPAAIRLTFGEPVDKRFVRISVRVPGNREVAAGSPSVAGTVVEQPLSARPAGTYTVTYRVVSADGHPITGRTTFTATSAAGSAPAPSPSAAPAAKQQEAAAAPAPAQQRVPATAPAPDRGWLVNLLVGVLCLVGIAALLVRTRSAEASSTP